MGHDSQRRRWPALAACALGALVALLGIAVLAGWLRGNEEWVRLCPSFGPMQPDAALGLVFFGGAVVLTTFRRRRLALAAALLTAAWGLVALLLQANLSGFTAEFLLSASTPSTHGATRMAPAAGLCFLLGGAALLLAGRPGPGAAIAGLLASLVFAFGLAVVLGYATTGRPPGLGSAVRMAVHTAGAFMLLAASTLILATREREFPGAFPRWIPIPVLLVGLTVSGGLWQTLRSQERTHTRETSQALALAVKGQVKRQVALKIQALTRLGGRWSPEERRPADLQAFAAENRTFHGLLAVRRIEPMLGLRWVVPDGAGGGGGADHPAFRDALHATLESARKRRRPTLSGPFDLHGGGRALLLAIPASARRKATGWIVGTYLARELLEEVLEKLPLLGQEVGIFDGQEQVCGSVPDRRAHGPSPDAGEVTIAVSGREWLVRVQPAIGSGARPSSRVPEGALAAGLLMTVLLSLTVYFAQSARARAGNAEAANLRLAQSEQRFRCLLDNAADAVFVHDEQGRFLDVNRRACDSLGYRPEELLALSVADVEADPEVARGLPARPGDTLTFQGEHRRKDGTAFPVEVRVAVLEWDHRPLRVSLARDTTDRRRAEEATRATAEHYRALFEGNPLPMWVYDPQTLRFLAVNEAAIRHYGYASEEFLAMTLQDIHPPEDVPLLLTHLAAPPQGREAAPVFRHRTKGGAVIEVEALGNEVVLDGRRARLVLVNDITEKRRLEEQLRQAQKMEAVGRLAGGVAHDFNNLLTIINGYGEVVLGSLPADHEAREPITLMVQAGARAARLTSQLLAFSRKQILVPRILDLDAVVFDLERLLRPLIGEDVLLRIETDPALGRVCADRGQLEQALLNLVVNARDAMPAGGRLTIEAHNVELDAAHARSQPDARTGPHVLLAVTDTGEGMDAATLARVWEPFFTTKGLGKGTGLGLATVYGVVRQSEGHVTVHSAPGLGTCFRIYLPRSVELPSGPERNGPTVLPRGAETVLLAEDEDVVRRFSREVLERCGYTVLEARDGAEAVRLGEQHAGRIDLLVCDVVMPHLGGREVTERLSACHPEAKALFVSGYTDDEVVRRGVLEARVPYLQKPYSPAALAQKARAVLDGG